MPERRDQVDAGSLEPLGVRRIAVRALQPSVPRGRMRTSRRISSAAVGSSVTLSNGFNCGLGHVHADGPGVAGPPVRRRLVRGVRGSGGELVASESGPTTMSADQAGLRTPQGVCTPQDVGEFVLWADAGHVAANLMSRV